MLIMNKFYFPKGGVEQYILEFEKIAKEKKHKTVQFSMNDERNWESPYSSFFISNIDFNSQKVSNYVKLCLTATETIYSLKSKIKLKKLLKTITIDVANIFNIYYQISPSVLIVLSKFNIPIVLFVNDYNLFCINYTFYDHSKQKVCNLCIDKKFVRGIRKRCLHGSFVKSLLAVFGKYVENRFKFYLKTVDHYVVASEFMRENLIKYGVDETKITKILNPLNVKEYEDCSSSPGQYGLYFGRFSKEKGLKNLIFAIKMLDNPLYKIKIIGEGEEKSEIEGLISDYKLQESVEMIPPTWGEKLKFYLSNSRFVIYPSIWQENSPMSVYQSLASGKPVVAPDTGGLRELIVNNVTGHLYNTNSVSDLASNIKKMFETSDEEIKVMGQNARHFAMCNFDSKIFYSKYERIVKDLIYRTGVNGSQRHGI